MIVRPAVIEDADGIYAIEEESFSIPWSMDSIHRDLANTALTMYDVLVRDDGAIKGYAGLWRVVDEGQITNIALAKDCRGEGYGELLLRVLMEAAWEKGCTSIFLEVRVSNTVALGLYRKLGYQTVSVRKKYYDDPVEDAYIMSCKKESYVWTVK
ncbi:MAG: ribosomal protein S18-alanine N-acetyltransferase [Megasphaera sp.]|jgi:ribosomal-protein-alanine N-acetyltransferase|nr:ribosomal protein S18-alanine N-acetyltransferase [Megasphaera sp.]MCH4218622.1 ribosomal protein S18-alanine N-acetyltransferase [Megasphaera sp.]